MSFLLALAMTGTIFPSNFDQSITPTDFFPGDESMAALVDFAIDARGKPIRCLVVYSVGDAGLAKKACPVLMHKHYQPAKNANGDAEYFVTRDLVRAFRPDTEQGQLVARSVSEPQMELTVAALPSHSQSMVGTLLLEIDQSGNAISCNVRSRPEPKFPKDICNHLEFFSLPIERDSAGNAVRYITTLKLKLSVELDAGNASLSGSAPLTDHAHK